MRSARWFRAAVNRQVRYLPLARPLASLTHSLDLHYSYRSSALLCLFVHSLVRSLVPELVEKRRSESLRLRASAGKPTASRLAGKPA